MKVAVVGGSLTGPALALLLSKAGADVEVFEAMPENVAQAGGVIGLDHVSLGVLDTIGVSQDEVIPFRSERVVSIQTMNREEMGRKQTVYPGRNTTWTLMHRALKARITESSFSITFHAGARVSNLTTGDDNRARLHFTNGDSTDADLVAFADGRKSIGRELLDPNRQLRYAGYVGHRGWATLCPPDMRDFMRWEPMVTGPVSYPAPPVSTHDLVADYTLYKTPLRTQFNTFPILQPDGSIGTDWTLYARTPEDQYREWFGKGPTEQTFVLPKQVKKAPEVVEQVNRMASDWLPFHVAQMVENTHTRMVAPIVDIDEPTQAVFPVGDSRAILLGDALAPVRPHTARGLNNGLDQAAGLVTAVAQHIKHNANLDAALAGWEERYLPQAVAAIRKGPELAKRIGLQ